MRPEQAKRDEDVLLPTPSEMVAVMDRTVIGQRDAKRGLAAAVYEHYIRHGLRSSDASLPARTDVICLHGPSGCGKTELLRSVSELLGVPTVIYDATRLSQVGYQGECVDDLFRALAAAADWDSEKASRGIVMLDEVDKLRREPTGGARDVSGEGVQRALLAMFSGTSITVSGSGSNSMTIDSSNLMVVLAGAFDGIEELVERRLGISAGRSLGFGSPRQDADYPSATALSPRAEPEDFRSYGFIPEFVGRVSSFLPIDSLGRDELRRVLTETELSALAAQRRHFAAHNIELHFTRPAIDYVVDEAVRRGTGARGLKGAILEVLAPVRFDLPDLSYRGVRRVVVNQAVVMHGRKPLLQRRPSPSRPGRVVTDLRARSHPRVLAAESSSVMSVSDTRGWPDAKIQDRLERVKDALDWAGTTRAAREWWVDFEKEYFDRPRLVLQLAEELVMRKATITEFFDAFCESGTDNIQGNLFYLDYLRLKRRNKDEATNDPREPGDPGGGAGS